jgi:hypothetical protein
LQPLLAKNYNILPKNYNILPKLAVNDKLALPFGSTTANFGPGCVGFQVPFRRLEVLPPLTRLVGDYQPTAGYSFPAYLTVPLESRSLTSAVCMLVSTSDDAFILLTPTRHRLRPDAQQILERKRCCFLPLEEALAATGPRQWRATEAAVQALQGFTGLHVPSAEADNGMAFFPTPAGATWADLSIRFADGHSVGVRVGGGRDVPLHADGHGRRPQRQADQAVGAAPGSGPEPRRADLEEPGRGP